MLTQTGICAAKATLFADEVGEELSAAEWFLTTLIGDCAAMVPFNTNLDPIINAAEECLITPGLRNAAMAV